MLPGERLAAGGGVTGDAGIRWRNRVLPAGTAEEG
jgi:hypothetical protein